MEQIIKISSNILHNVSPLIYGSFLEFIDSQISLMWGEQLYDYSFEGDIGYSDATLYYWQHTDDITKNEWYHSGYEKNPWQKIGDDTVELCFTQFNKFFHGTRAAMVRNKSRQAGGLYQGGICLHNNETYAFSIYMATDEHQPVKGPIKVQLTDASLKRVYDEYIFSITPEYQQYRCFLKPEVEDPNATFIITFEGPGTLFLDLASLTATSCIKGWRFDVVEALRKVHPTIIRFPGGCFTSFSHWENAIGPIIDRQPFPNVYWGGMEPNLVGTDEFIDLCRLIGAEPMICINMLTGSPSEAARWVEYCNGFLNTYFGRIRAENGYPEPFNVKFWEMDNEPYRRFSPRQYGKKVVEFAKEMKKVDPKIKIMVAGYGPYFSSLNTILDICSSEIDYVATRANNTEELQQLASVISKYSSGSKIIKIASTEWLGDTKKIGFELKAGERDTLYGAGNHDWLAYWGYALEVASVLHIFQRNPLVEIANFNNIANTWGQNLLEINKQTCIISAAGKVFELFSYNKGDQFLDIQVDGILDVTVTRSSSTQEVFVSVINKTDVKYPCKVICDTLTTAGKAAIFTVYGPSKTSRNTFTNPDTIQLIKKLENFDKGQVEIEVQPLSVTLIKLTPDNLKL